jgi:hypothetical protein
MAADELVPLFVVGGMLFAVVIGSGILMYRWQYRTADAKLHRWAQQFHYTVVEKHGANPLGTGPLARSGNKQVMYRVTVEDASGARRCALVTIGGRMTGVLSDELSVEWE